MMILALMLSTSLVVGRVESNAWRDRFTLSMAAMYVWYSLGHIMDYGFDFHVRTISGRQ